MDHPGPVEPEQDVKNIENHYIKKLLGKQVTQGQTQYLMQWLEYGLEHNVWYDIQDLKAAARLLSDYKQSHPMVLSNTQLRTTA